VTVSESHRHWLLLASALDAAEVISGVRGAHEDVPPAGTELHQSVVGDVSEIQAPVLGLRLPFYVTGVSDYSDPSDWSHTTLGAFINQVGLDHVAWYARLATLFDKTVGRVISTIDQWPVIVKGTREDNEMRWIRSIVAGTLGAVEDFEFGFNWGIPGADPDFDESTMTTLADEMALALKDALNAVDGSTGGAALTSIFANDIKFTEVGVVKQTITDAKDKYGHGGNLSQAFETKWSKINGTPGVVGTGSTKSLPYEVACCVTFDTDHRGPSGRGRAYLPPLKVESLNTGGVFLPEPITAAATIIHKWIQNVAAVSDLLPVVVSQRRVILNEIKSISVGIVPDSQRRRRWHQLEAPLVVWTHA